MVRPRLPRGQQRCSGSGSRHSRIGIREQAQADARPTGSTSLGPIPRTRVPIPVVKGMFGLRLDVALATFRILLGGEVIDAEGVGILGDLHQKRDTPAAAGSRAETIGHLAGPLGVDAPAEANQLPHGNAVTVA